MVCRVLLACLCCLLPPSTGATDLWGEPFVDAIDDQDSIVEDNITALLEDRQGFIWIGTPTGLLRFDGYRFKPYRHRRDDPQSIAEGFVRSLAVAADGRLWIGTNAAGISILDTRTDTFEHLRADAPPGRNLPSDSIRDFAVDARGDLWIATNGGLARADGGTGRISRIRLSDDAKDSADPQIAALAISSQDELWIGSSLGLFRRSGRSGEISPFALADALGLGATEPSVRALLAADDGSLWVGTVDATALHISSDGKTITRLQLPPASPTASPEPIKPLAMVQENPQTVWLGSSGALARCDVASVRCQIPRLHDPLVQAGFAQPDIRSMLRDRSGQVWIGGYGSGLQRITTGNSALQMLRYRPGDARGLGSPSISAIFVDDDGTLFLGSRGKGIEVFHPERGVIDRLPPSPGGEAGIEDGAVTALLRTRDGHLWAGTDFGLIEYRYPSRQGRRYQREQGLPSNTIRRLFEDGAGRLWVGTNAGLAWLDREQAQFNEARSPDGAPWRASINALVAGDDGRLWIGSVLGLYTLEQGQDSVQAADDSSTTRPPASVLGLLLDRGDTLWIDRTDGLQRLRFGEGKDARFEAIGASLGLDGEPFGANLLRDPLGRIWTQRYMYDPDTHSAHELLRADGADLGTVWFRSYAQDRQGRLYFGGSRGILRVTPDEFAAWQYTPPVVISELRIDGQPQALPVDGEPVTVRADQQTVAVEFAALDYSAPQRLHYAYQLVGHDADWVTVDASRRLASYSNLWPGEYRLRIRGSNRTGQWSPQEVNLRLRVEPAYWQRPLFALAMLALLATLFAFGLRLNAQRLRQRAQELQEQVSARTVALTNAKQRAEAAMRELGDARKHIVAAENMAAFGKLAKALVDDVLSPLDDAIAAIHDVATRLRDDGRTPGDVSPPPTTQAQLSREAASSALQATERTLKRLAMLLRDLKSRASQSEKGPV